MEERSLTEELLRRISPRTAKKLLELLELIGEEKLLAMVERRLRRERRGEVPPEEAFRRKFASAVLRLYLNAYRRLYGNRFRSVEALASLLKKWTEYVISSEFPKRKDPETLLKFASLYIFWSFERNFTYRRTFGLPEEGWKEFFRDFSVHEKGEGMLRARLRRADWERVKELAKELYSDSLSEPEIKEFLEEKHVVF